MKNFLRKVSKSFRAGEKGFTLIELLIVIVILGVLAAVAIPQVTKFIRSGKVSAANSELAMVKTAIGAGMADAQVITIDATVPFTFDKGHDMLIATLAHSATGAAVNVSTYIQGGISGLTGAYVIDVDGNVSSATYTGTDLTWNTPIANGKFQ